MLQLYSFRIKFDDLTVTSQPESHPLFSCETNTYGTLDKTLVAFAKHSSFFVAGMMVYGGMRCYWCVGAPFSHMFLSKLSEQNGIWYCIVARRDRSIWTDFSVFVLHYNELCWFRCFCCEQLSILCF